MPTLCIVQSNGENLIVEIRLNIPMSSRRVQKWLFRNLVEADSANEDRIHDSLSEDTPTRRPVEPKPSAKTTVISSTRLGGLHHRYTWEEAA
jgi:hypothetical protein